jgi:hypothetical protein
MDGEAAAKLLDRRMLGAFEANHLGCQYGEPHRSFIDRARQGIDLGRLEGHAQPQARVDFAHLEQTPLTTM